MRFSKAKFSICHNQRIVQAGINTNNNVRKIDNIKVVVTFLEYF